MFIEETQVRVRYGETDQMGYVYYGNYALYYEVGRVDALRQLGMSYHQMEQTGVMMPVVDMHCKYIKPAHYDDLLTIKTIIREVPSSRIHFEYELYNQHETLVNKGSTTLVFVDQATSRLTRCPEPLLGALKERIAS